MVVIDDGSTDSTPDVLETEMGRGNLRVRVIRHERSVGPGAARNVGWRSSRAALIAFMDDDCEADSGWLEAAIAAWGGDPGRFLQGQTVPIPEEEHLIDPYSYTVDVRAPDIGYQTCNMLYPRALLERIGGFDPDAFPYPQGEDTDLAFRAQKAGAVPVWAPEARMRHAVVRLGPLGFLRRAWSWGNCMELCTRHPEFRRERLVHRYFWNRSHYFLLRLLLALALPRRRWLWPLKLWLARPYVRTARHPVTMRYSLRLLPWRILVDAVELTAVVRGSLRHGTLVL